MSTRWSLLSAVGLLLALGASSPLVEAALASDGSCPLLTIVPFSNEARRNGPPSEADAERIERWPSDLVAVHGYTYMAAVQLAVYHFNNRDSSVVPELAQLQDCQVHFPEQVVLNSAMDETKTITGILTAHHGLLQQQGMIQRRPDGVLSHQVNNDNDDNDNDCPSLNFDNLLPPWCAILGPQEDRNAIRTSVLTGALDIPQLLYSPVSGIVISPDSLTTIGVNLGTMGQAQGIVSYLQRPGLERDYLYLLRNPSPRLSDLTATIVKVGDKAGLKVMTGVNENGRPGGPENEEDAKEGMRRTVQKIKRSGIMTIMLRLENPNELVDLAAALHEEGMLAPDYLYLFLEELVGTRNATSAIFGRQKEGSPLDNLLSGAVVITPTDRIADHSKEGVFWVEDPFLHAWRMQNDSLVHYLNTLVPVNEMTGEKPFQAEASFFQDTPPAHMASFIYDSVMAAGFGACAYQAAGDDRRNLMGPTDDGVGPGGGSRQEPTQPNASEPSGTTLVILTPLTTSNSTNTTTTDTAEDTFPRPSPATGGGPGQRPNGAPGGMGKPSSKSLVSSILESSFNGASGKVSFGGNSLQPFDKNRDINGVYMGAFNIRPSPVAETTGLRTYTSTLTSYTVLTSTTEPNDWNPIPDEEFIYRDGGTVAPSLLREIDNQNFLSEWVHIFGLALFSTALFIAVASAICVRYIENDPHVKAGQPPFLYMLCFGSALMSTAIFTLSWDESYGWSDKQLDVACILTPWFFFIGQILMFSALFTKLWRVDKVLQFSKRQVKIVQVLAPLAMLLLAAVVVLTVWTAIDPYVWERTLIQDTPAETYGQCTSENTSIFFLVLAGLMIIAKVATAVMAWKTADIPHDFSDTSSVFYAITTHLQAWVVGIPILAVLGNDSVNASYFGRVLLIWVFSVSGVGLVVIPKLYRAFLFRQDPAMLAKRDRVNISVLNAPSGLGAPFTPSTVSGPFTPSTVSGPFTPSTASRPFTPPGQPSSSFADDSSSPFK